MQKWTYQGKEVLELPENVAGFCYLITNQITGQKYIGKKFAEMKVSKRIKTKTAAAKATTKKVVSYKSSNWAVYMGSSIPLKEDIKKYGVENFKREILCFGKSKADVNFLEVFIQIKTNALLDETFYNNCIGSRDFISMANNKSMLETVKQIIL